LPILRNNYYVYCVYIVEAESAALSLAGKRGKYHG
jgi:hypothetical protein